jgi:hypothetical protein
MAAMGKALVAGSALIRSAALAGMMLTPSVIAILTQTSYEAAAATDPKTLAAVFTLAGVIFSAIVSAGISLVLAWFTAKGAVNTELKKRQNELALKISDLVSAENERTKQAAMRRFAVGMVKIVEPEGHPENGKVYFIPMNARITVGRSEDNDIVLKDDNNWLSRWQCGFIADQKSVWIDDFISKNGTMVGSQAIATSHLLSSGDEIVLGPFKLRFQRIRENTILSQ